MAHQDLPRQMPNSAIPRPSRSRQDSSAGTRRWQEVPGAEEDKALPPAFPIPSLARDGAMVTNHLDAIPVHHPGDAGSTRDRFSLRTFIRIVS